ncbi:alpha/beta hydrolase [Herbidospora mongoliensis]|uniref:alpha/beta hydrolase n=1 Tax=Herbidospora mongoliensis TaxID=688067 RepID=UPI0009FBC813|nr:alpha/beta hydrolase [Herbidospora mongoliensis]
MVDQTASLERVTAIAVEHHTALDQATRLVHAIAWTGGGTSAFAELMTEQRTTLRMALSESISLFSGTPEFTSPIPLLPRPMGTFAGFSRDVLPSLAGELCAASRSLLEIAGFLLDELSSAGKSDRPARIIADIAFWSGEQAEKLRERLLRLPPGKILSASLAAYWMFGDHVDDTADAEPLLARVSAGDPAAVDTLLGVQHRVADLDLGARVNAWWTMQPPKSRMTSLGLPGFGGLHGLPGVVRNSANREFLQVEQGLLTHDLHRLGASVMWQSDRDLPRSWDRVNGQLKRLEKIKSAMTPVPGYPDPMLLGFDVTGQGRLTVSWGDPDTAQTTVIFVHGLNTGLADAMTSITRAQLLWRQASTMAGTPVACVTWDGYDAPLVDFGAFSPDRNAHLGGQALTAFCLGLRAAHTPSTSARNVLIGHGDGALTVHRALAGRAGLADDVIIIERGDGDWRPESAALRDVATIVNGSGPR